MRYKICLFIIGWIFAVTILAITEEDSDISELSKSLKKAKSNVEKLVALKKYYKFKPGKVDVPLVPGFILEINQKIARFTVTYRDSFIGGGINCALKTFDKEEAKKKQVSVIFRTFASVPEAEDETLLGLNAYMLIASEGSLSGKPIGDHCFCYKPDGLVVQRRNIHFSIHPTGQLTTDEIEQLANEIVTLIDKEADFVSKDNKIKVPTITSIKSKDDNIHVNESTEITVEVEGIKDKGHYQIDHIVWITEGDCKGEEGNKNKATFTALKAGIYKIGCIIVTSGAIVVRSNEVQECTIEVLPKDDKKNKR